MLLSRLSKITLLSAFLTFSAPTAGADTYYMDDVKRNVRVESTRTHKCKTVVCGQARGGTVSTSRVRTDDGETHYIRVYKTKNGEITKVVIDD